MRISQRPLHNGRFSKWYNFSNIWCFFHRFFAQNNCKWFVEWILKRFFLIKFLNGIAKWGFWKGFSPVHDGRFCKWSHFSNFSCFSCGFFAQNNSKWFVEWILPYFLEFEFLTQSRILQVCKSGVVYARTRFFQYFFKSRNRKCSFFRLPGNLIARLHLTLSKTSENYENMAFRGRPDSDCTSNFLRADSQRGAAESTIARKKRGRVV